MSAEGFVVGRYTVGRRLGQGYSGTVHEARDGATTVALKLVHSDREQWLIDAERRGAQLQQAFGRAHGMVPDIYEIGEADRYFYIAMEFMTVPTLERLTKPMTPAQAVGFARAICVVLEKLHSFTLPDASYEAVMHADLKPEHVFVMEDGTVKVFDFGTAKGLEPSRPGTTVVGLTPHYAPPERLTEGKARVGDDLWAVGVMLYEMVAGHRPHSRKEANRWDLERAIASNDAREPLPSGCPPALAAIIDKLLKLQREHRYKSAADIKADLDAFLADREPAAQKTYNTVETIKTPRPAEPPPPPIPVVRAEPEPAARPQIAQVAARRGLGRRALWSGFVLLLVIGFLSEALGCVMAEGMRSELPQLNGDRLSRARQDYGQLLAWTPVGFGVHLRVDRPLRARLIAVADEVIAGYRAPVLTVFERQWRHCQEALTWAAQIDSDNSLRAKALVCDGHLERIAAQTIAQKDAPAALRQYSVAATKFQRAAALDAKSPDPHLGLGRIYLEPRGLNDVDKGVAAIQEAERRGHVIEWRQRADIGHAYRVRADGFRREGERELNLDSSEHSDAFERARADYERCVEFLSPIADRARSELRDCRRYVRTLTDAIEARAREPQWQP
jgi:eukaryotic-like serine/threonine-protein kinase